MRADVVTYWEKARGGGNLGDTIVSKLSLSRILTENTYIPSSHYIFRWTDDTDNIIGCVDHGGQQLATTLPRRHR